MNMVLHILKKDICRLRLFLIFWLPIMLLAVGANIIRPAADNFALQEVQQLIAAFVAGLQFLTMALIVPSLMHSEPLIGTTGFWRTRPMKKSDIMKSKFLFAGIFFVVLPTVVNLVFLVGTQVPPAYILAMIPQYFLRYFSRLLLLMAIASLTGSFRYYSLVGGIYIAVSAFVAIIVSFAFQYGELADLLETTALMDSRRLLSDLVGVALLCLLIYAQYNGRRIVRSYILLTLYFILNLWIASFSSWSIFQNPVRKFTESQVADGDISVSVDKTKRLHARDAVLLSKEPQKVIWGTLSYNGFPEDCFARENEITVAFEANGCRINDYKPEIYSFGSGYADMEALQFALEHLDIIPAKNKRNYPSRLLRLSKSDYANVRQEAGIYRADITFDVFRYRQVVSLPLAAGQEYATERFRFEIATVLAETKGCTVIAREQYINPLFMRNREPFPGNRFLYLLVNLKTKEAFLPERGSQNYWPDDYSSFAVVNKPLHFSSIDKATCSIDEQWLENAELMIVESQWLGEACKKIEDLTFRLSEPSPEPSVIPGSSAQNHLEQLAAIQLSENPSRDEVRAYIKRIHNISVTQEHFSSKDPQISMLFEIGPENLDLLIQQILDSESNYYEQRAIRALTQPEHKDLVLRYLYQIPVLARAVNNYEWQQDAREILLDGLREKDILPADWLIAVMRLNDSSNHPLLVDFFARGEHFLAKTYRTIKDIPGIEQELDDAVSKVWKRVRDGDPAPRCAMIPIALGHGHYDALAAAVEGLSKESMPEHLKVKFCESIQEHTGIKGSDEELRTWFDSNENHLLFNPETKMFECAAEPVRVALQSGDAVIEGTIKYLEQDGLLGFWRQPEDHIQFHIPRLGAGTYRLIAKYAAHDGHGGRVLFRLNDRVNDTKLEKDFSSTGGWRVPSEEVVGNFEHPGGFLDITMTILEQKGPDMIVVDLYSLTIEQIQQNQNEGMKIL